ncbi:MAG: UDP-N-acetylmuramate dehydrogenase [Candidatus Daviesbacteria bacterium]
MEFQENIPLAPLTTFKIGGPAKYFCKAQTQKDILEGLKFAKEKSLLVFILGGGSNLLISDEGFPGLVIKNEAHNIVLQGQALQAESGARLANLISFAIQNEMAGLEKLVGIPGTVGGAVSGNAGAYGQGADDYVSKVLIFDPAQEKILTLSKEDCQFSYRSSIFKSKPYIILEATFELPKGNREDLKAAVQKILADRGSKSFYFYPSPGSFFKNIPLEKVPEESFKLIPKEKITFNKIAAGYLLEMVGAKGQKVGDVQVLETHANFIVNLGDGLPAGRQGKASDVIKLASDLVSKVKEKYGIKLEPEVQFVNLPPLS